MELDAIFMLIQITKDGIKEHNNLLIMESYIYNKNIDINLSIRENIHLFIQENDDMSNSTIDNILSSDEKYYDVKIYNLLLEDIKMRYFLINSLKKKLLTDESILNIIETILTGTQDIEYSVSRDEILRFLVNFLSNIKAVDKRKMRESLIINTFVKNSISLLVNNSNSSKPSSRSSFFDSIVLYKLFSGGYASFYYNQVIDPESEEKGIEDIILPLVRTRSYGHLRLMINKSTIRKEDLGDLKEAIKKGLREFYDADVNPIDAKMDKNFVEKMNLYFKLVDVECLNYEEITQPSLKLS